jgi:hypothetical protein
MKVNVRLFSLLAPIIALALASGPARADSQAAAVAQELERARALASRQDHKNACKAYSRANELAGGKSAPSLIGVANCYKQTKEGDKAVATARQALAVAATPGSGPRPPPPWGVPCSSSPTRSLGPRPPTC